NDPVKIAALKSGKSYIASIAALEKNFEAASSFARLADADAIVICVPTPLTSAGKPDLGPIRRTVAVVARHLQRGQLVVLESTTYPGTTREEVLPRLKKAGKPFLLGYSPERQDPGNRLLTLETIPRLVSGVDDDSKEATAELYRAVTLEVIAVPKPEIAEAAKLLENVYRSVNIAL